MSFLDDYEPVEVRIEKFYADHPSGGIRTELVRAEGGDYICKALVWREPGSIGPDATGYAHDSEAQLPNNMKASALEVCETSAIGRALANLGYAPKGKRPSREEMSKASSGALNSFPAPGVGRTQTAGGASAPNPSGEQNAPVGTAEVTRGEVGEGEASASSPAVKCKHPMWHPSPTINGWKVCDQCGTARKGATT